MRVTTPPGSAVGRTSKPFPASQRPIAVHATFVHPGTVQRVKPLVRPAAHADAADAAAVIERLAERAAGGDRAAFDALYARTVDRVYAVCLRLSGDRTTAERLTQDTYVRVWQKLRTFRRESAFTTWVHRLAVNVVLNDGRQRQRIRGHEQALGDRESLIAGPDRGDAELRLDVERAIAALPTRARAVLVLHDVEGYKHYEIAALLGIATGTAKAQLHRARRLLKQRLER